MDYRVREKIIWAADLLSAVVLILLVVLGGLVKKYWWAVAVAVIVVVLGIVTFLWPGVWFYVFSRIPWEWFDKIVRVVERWFVP